ncbi:hypothetical protein DL767_003924 [Monosporascus sp. MG133]|nr:hypothetical protein DL767_003924 [Monosporascus sp. MG133]
MGGDLGCITQEGFWTADEDKRGTFTSEKRTAATYPLQIKGELGYYQPSPFDCTKSAQTTPGFSTWVDATVPGRGVLVSGNGGIYASNTGNNPLLPGEVSKIKFYSGTEKGNGSGWGGRPYGRFLKCGHDDINLKSAGVPEAFYIEHRVFRTITYNVPKLLQAGPGRDLRHAGEA